MRKKHDGHDGRVEDSDVQTDTKSLLGESEKYFWDFMKTTCGLS